MLTVDFEKCTGCGACVQRCPKQCISWARKEFGFRYPQIDKDACVNCGSCEKVCPIDKALEVSAEQKAYAAVHKDTEVLAKSTSGGAFTAIADAVFAQGGIVYGAAMLDDMQVKHIRTTGKDDFERLAAYDGLVPQVFISHFAFRLSRFGTAAHRCAGLSRVFETFRIQHSQLAGDGRDLDLQAGQVGCRRDKVDHGIDRDSQSEGLAGDAELGEHDRVAGQRAAGDGRHRQRQKPGHNDHRKEPRGRDGRAEIFRHAQAGRHKSDRNAGHIEDLFQGHGEMREHRRDTQLLLAGL